MTFQCFHLSFLPNRRRLFLASSQILVSTSFPCSTQDMAMDSDVGLVWIFFFPLFLFCFLQRREAGGSQEEEEDTRAFFLLLSLRPNELPPSSSSSSSRTCSSVCSLSWLQEAINCCILAPGNPAKARLLRSLTQVRKSVTHKDEEVGFLQEGRTRKRKRGSSSILGHKEKGKTTETFL